MVDKNDDLLREVDEALRRDRMEKLWDKYGIYALVAAGVLVALVGGFKFVEGRHRAAAEAGGAQFETAAALAQANKTDEAAKALEAIATGDKPGYAALAELKIAGALNKAGKTAEALAAFDKLAVKPGVDRLFTGFAQLQAAALVAGEADFTELKNRLTPLMVETSPWQATATEMLGTAAIKAGKLDEARLALAPLLADPRLPRTAVERVRTLMEAIAAIETSRMPVAPAAPTSTAAPAPVVDPGTAKPGGTK